MHVVFRIRPFVTAAAKHRSPTGFLLRSNYAGASGRLLLLSFEFAAAKFHDLDQGRW